MDLCDLEARARAIRLKIYQPDDTWHYIGDSGPLVEWHLHNPDTLAVILKQPELNLGTSYVRGDWDMDTTQLPKLIQTLVPKIAKQGLLYNRPCLRRLRARLPHWRQGTNPGHWQDISTWVSKACFGEELLQGCGYFAEPGVSLEEAQRSERRRLLGRLQLQPGQQILDLDAGWGSLAIFLAEQEDVRVTAIARTREQMQFMQKQTRERGLAGRFNVRLGSFRHCRGRFDRILAAGFLERHPEPTYPVVFRAIEGLLQDDGLAWIQFTGRNKDIGLSNRWLQNQLPSLHSLPLLSDLTSALETTHLRILRLADQSSHWQHSLEHWGQRLYRHRAAISQRFGEAHVRHWEFMLASQETAARWGQMSYYDLLLGNTRTRWPSHQPNADSGLEDVPLDQCIPGLARDI